MKFTDVFGNLKRVRPFASRGATVSDSDVTEPGKLAELLRQIQKRISTTEAITPPEALELEYDVTSGLDFNVAHNFGGPVRWYVVDWYATPGAGASGPSFSRLTTSTTKLLVLHSYCAGRVVIRVESSFNASTPV